jgi:Cu-processing system ATP-binding protein
MDEKLIDLRSVGKRYGALQAVDGIDLSVGRGRMVGLIGHNGAGKSTLFKMMLGLLEPTSGEVRLCGVATQDGAFRDVRRRIGYLPENFVAYDNLTGMELLQLFADLKKVARKACGNVLERVGLSAAADRRVGGYSKGMRPSCCSARRSWSSLTSRPTASIPTAATISTASCTSCARRARPSSSLRTSWRRSRNGWTSW